MKSKKRVLAALAHRVTDRVPVANVLAMYDEARHHGAHNNNSGVAYFEQRRTE